MSMLTLYFLVMLDSIGNFFVGMTLVGWGLIIVFFIISYAAVDCGGDEDHWKKIRSRLFKVFSPIVMLLTLIATLIPSTKQVAFIYVVGSLSQNKIVQNIGTQSLQIPEKALEILNVKMNSYLEDMKQEALKETKSIISEKDKALTKYDKLEKEVSK